ncbi:flavin reductase [Arthrobacter sp.]|uniref:flavin reductase n=1 Tax=Arthrobacter sp. TaxID=1667 RepID=UPI003398FEE0
MSELEIRTPIDPRRFRDVLGQYPTGVSVVTATQADGTAVGLAVGSFTSVSLDPPLVAFLADRGSTSWPKIQATGAFCANVLAADQQHVCRAFASKAPDKFADLEWSAAGSGSPILDGAVAWIDCDIQTVHEAGDHFIVIGEVRELQVANPTLPLLFFRGGYGSFAPSSSTAVEGDLLGHLRMVDTVRPWMDDIARDLDVECNAAVVVRGEFVYIARAGHAAPGEAPTRVGRRLPFRPPVGSAFVAWGTDSAAESWLGRLGDKVAAEEREAWMQAMGRVRQRGYSVGLGHHAHDALWARLINLSEPQAGPDPEMERIIDALLVGYEQRDFATGKTYDVRTISAPVFGHHGETVFQFTLYGLPRHCDAEAIQRFAARLMAGANGASQALREGGPLP